MKSGKRKTQEKAKAERKKKKKVKSPVYIFVLGLPRASGVLLGESTASQRVYLYGE